MRRGALHFTVRIAVLTLALRATPARAQRPAPRDSGDTGHARVLDTITVSVTRGSLPLTHVPGAVSVADGADRSPARPAWGLDDALASVPGVHAFNRWNFSLDQRLSIRGFGARSSFGVRGVKVLLDGVPQTLPDGSGQLTNVELGAADRIEVLRGSSSALFGNAAGGVISIITDAEPPRRATWTARLLAGSWGRGAGWTKWQSDARLHVGRGTLSASLSRLVFDGPRQNDRADLRRATLRYVTATPRGTRVAASLSLGDDPRADNPGALTSAELAANPDSAATINLTRRAGKDVRQVQGSLSVRRPLAGDGEVAVTVFGLARTLDNPQTFAFIQLDRRAAGVRAQLTRAVRVGGLAPRFTAGLDVQRQHDDRLNTGNQTGVPDTVRQLAQTEQVTEFGPFLQAVLPVGTRLSVTAGGRWDRIVFDARDDLVTPANPDDSGRRVMTAPSGILGATLDVMRTATVYANLATSFETPTTTELANRPDTAGGFNPALGPQRAMSGELGARGMVAGRVQVTVAAFHAAVRDELIAYQVPGSPGRVFYRNAGRARHQGLEVGADAALLPGLRAQVAWTWSDFRYTRYAVSGRVLDGRPLPGIPRHRLTSVWQARPAFAHGAWVEIQTTHSAGVLVNDTLETRAAGWWTADLRAGWDGARGGTRARPFVGISNVRDTRYVSSVVINASGGRYFEPAPGRGLVVGFAVGGGR